jgi:hypothetical protein
MNQSFSVSRGDVYILMIKTLLDDGFYEAAEAVSNAAQLSVQPTLEQNQGALPAMDNNRLQRLIEHGLEWESSESTVPTIYSASSHFDDDHDSDLHGNLPGIDLDAPDDNTPLQVDKSIIISIEYCRIAT